MSRQMILLFALVLALAAGADSAFAQGVPEFPDIFRLEISECMHDPAGVRYQTGFRVVGVVGIVTALHGVADDCKQISAVGGGDDGPVFNNLTLIKVDVDADVALLSSPQVKTAARKPQLKAMSLSAALKPSDSLQVIGYPYGMYEQLPSSSLRVRDRAMVPLSRLIPPNLIAPIRARNSPSTSISVVSVEGHFLPGQSGAPVFNNKREIVGVVNGGLQEGHAEVSWMMEWNHVFLESVGEQEVKARLEELKTTDPLLVFSAGTDSVDPTATPKAAPVPVIAAPAPTPLPTQCPISADPDLAAYAQPTLGCPTSGAKIVWSSYTPFERGFMLWRSDTGRIYGFFNGTGWTDVEDRFRDGMPDYVEPGRGDPPPGLTEPKRGTGLVWATNDQFFQSLGWATSEQRGFCAEIQEFSNGFIAHKTNIGQCNDLVRNEPRTSRAGEPGFSFDYVAAVLSNRAWYP